MRFAYAHFPVNVNVAKDGSNIEIKNFLGEKLARKIDMPEGVKIIRKEDIKDEIVIEGNDITQVSRSCKIFIY